MLATLVAALLMAAPACADSPVLMAFGDSITKGTWVSPTEAFPALLRQQRPDYTVVNEGQGGDVSDDRPRFIQALAAHHPRVVVLMLGTNDAQCQPGVLGCDAAHATPDRTAENLMTMARLARDQGATVYVLTPTPSRFIFGPMCAREPKAPVCQTRAERERIADARQTYTREVAHRLLRWPPTEGIVVLDLRDQFTVRDWTTLSVDGLHPNPAGHAVIAKFLAKMIPAPADL
jgi:lysophospholipase L1-like esterase